MTVLSTDQIDIPISLTTGDIVITNGRFLPSSGLTAIVQGVRRRIQVIAGEWFLDLDFGVRWFERAGVPATLSIFGQKFNPSFVDTEIRAAILATPGVTAVSQLDVAFVGTTRTLSISWQAKCVFGDTPVDVIAVGA